MYVHSLSIENVKAFEELSLDFARPDDYEGDAHYAGFNVFLGGNASGKSTLLKCLAMALSGPATANQHLISPTGWIRKGQTKASIALQVYWEPGGDDPFRGRGNTPTLPTFDAGLAFEAEQESAVPTLKVRAKQRLAERGPWHQEPRGWFLGAYGPLRRLTGSSTDALRYSLAQGKVSSCVTLFREDAALTESDTWLKQEHARALEQRQLNRLPVRLVENVQAFLNDGLLPDGFQISRITVDHVYMSTPNGGELPLRDLSDGCRSTYALMLDIIHSMAMCYGTAELFGTGSDGKMAIVKPGVIIIDELEAHLHPAWQQKICEWLKARFPRIQFFVTTHSPLIAQSADSGGVFVLPLPHEMAEGGGVRRLTRDEHERIVLGRADSVLLGEAFGLRHTWGEHADALVKRWELLSAQWEAKVTWNEELKREHQALSRQMKIVFDDDPHPGDA